MAAAQGLMYRVWFDNQSITNAAQDIIQISAAAGVPILIHSYKLTVVPTINSGIAQDVRAQLRWILRTAAGTGGTALTPSAVNARNTVAAAGTYTQLVTTVGTASTQEGAMFPSIVTPIDDDFGPYRRILVNAGKILSLNLETALGAAYSASFEAVVEEI